MLFVYILLCFLGLGFILEIAVFVFLNTGFTFFPILLPTFLATPLIALPLFLRPFAVGLIILSTAVPLKSVVALGKTTLPFLTVVFPFFFCFFSYKMNHWNV